LSCASTRDPVYSLKAKGKNPYYQSYSEAAPTARTAMAQTSLELLLRADAAWVADLTQEAKGFGGLDPTAADVLPILGSLQPGILRWDPAAQMMRLDDASSIERGPYWLELVRAEAAGLALARDNGVRDYQPGACASSYAQALREHSSTSQVEAPAPLDPALASLFTQPTEPQKMFDAAVKASNSNLVDAIAGRSPGAQVRQPRKGGDGELLVQSTDRKIAEWRELRPNAALPAAWTGGARAATPAERCAWFKRALTVARPGFGGDCIVLNDHAYGEYPLPNLSFAMDLEKVTTGAQLRAVMQALCRQAAVVHISAWNPGARNRASLALRGHPALQSRLVRLAFQTTEKLFSAHQMIFDDRAAEEKAEDKQKQTGPKP